MEREKYLVTGAGGFVGSGAVRALDQKADVIAVIRPGGTRNRLENCGPNTKVVEIDLTNWHAISDLLKRERPHHILNLVSYGVYPDQRDPLSTYFTNTLPIVLIAFAARDIHPHSITHTGSVFEYGNKTGQLNENEASPTNHYGKSKYLSTLLARFMAKNFELPITTLRLFTTYGEYESRTRFISATILRCLSLERPRVVPGLIRDYIYLHDVVAAFIKASEHPVPGETINIGSGTGFRLEDVASLIADITGNNQGIIIDESLRQPNNSSCYSNINKAAKLLNWSPTIDLNRGLRQTIEWFRTNRHYYSKK